MSNGPHVPHGHHREHASLWLAHRPPTRPVHRVGRRQFLTELGRNTFAIAVLGGVVTACAGDRDLNDRDAIDGDAIDGDANGADHVASGGTQDASSAGVNSDDGTSVPNSATEPDRARWAQVNLGSVSAYVIVRGNEAAVVDTGNPGSTDEIGRALSTLNATFDDVRHVVLTHSHPDHIGSLSGVLEAAPSATPYAGALDISNIAAAVDVTAVGDGDEVFGLRVIETPGHTPGSISVLDPGIGLLLAGDTVNGNSDGTGLTGPNERFTADMRAANRSVLKLAGFEVEAIGMGHGQPVTIDAGTVLLGLIDHMVASGDLPAESSSE
jgi:glyoxylase-like metal-dependent hydrolase (beta-lactamase superfamily II)